MDGVNENSVSLKWVVKEPVSSKNPPASSCYIYLGHCTADCHADETNAYYQIGNLFVFQGRVSRHVCVVFVLYCIDRYTISKSVTIHTYVRMLCLCVCMCMHVCLYVCMGNWICICFGRVIRLK